MDQAHFMCWKHAINYADAEPLVLYIYSCIKAAELHALGMFVPI